MTISWSIRMGATVNTNNTYTQCVCVSYTIQCNAGKRVRRTIFLCTACTPGMYVNFFGNPVIVCGLHNIRGTSLVTWALGRGGGIKKASRSLAITIYTKDRRPTSSTMYSRSPSSVTPHSINRHHLRCDNVIHGTPRRDPRHNHTTVQHAQSTYVQVLSV